MLDDTKKLIRLFFLIALLSVFSFAQETRSSPKATAKAATAATTSCAANNAQGKLARARFSSAIADRSVILFFEHPFSK